MSVLPLVDEFVIAVGNSKDETLNLIESIQDPKIKIIHTVWDDTLRQGGKVLAVETDKALANVSSDADWCIYIQGDECFHESDYAEIRNGMSTFLHDPKVEGLLFDYIHFFGSYDWMTDSFSRYRREIRIIRNKTNIQSWGDAQGFRKHGQKLKVKKIKATVYHYGMVKSPEDQQKKQKYFNKLWHSDEWVDKNVGHSDTFIYDPKEILLPFQGNHPSLMLPRIKAQNWKIDFGQTPAHVPFKLRFKMWWEKLTGKRIGEYKNYILLP